FSPAFALQTHYLLKLLLKQEWLFYRQLRIRTLQHANEQFYFYLLKFLSSQVSLLYNLNQINSLPQYVEHSPNDLVRPYIDMVSCPSLQSCLNMPLLIDAPMNFHLLMLYLIKHNHPLSVPAFVQARQNGLAN